MKTATIEVPEKVELKERIERALKVADVAAQKESLGPEYQRFVEAMNEAGDPRDDTMIVFADFLQSADDPRGELIVVQTELETATREERETLRERENKLLAAHRRQLVPNVLDGRLTSRPCRASCCAPNAVSTISAARWPTATWESG